jgi:hypothetical protein
MSWLFGMEGRLASDALIQAPRRTGVTVAALMFSLAFVLVMATFSVSVKASFSRWIDATINPDLFVYASESVATRTFQFPASVASELKTVSGVRQVDSARIITMEYNEKSAQLMSIEVDQWLRRSTPLMEEGRVEDLLPGMLGKNGVLISNNFARLHNLKKGSCLSLNTPAGRQVFEIGRARVTKARCLEIQVMAVCCERVILHRARPADPIWVAALIDWARAFVGVIHTSQEHATHIRNTLFAS